MLFYNSAFKQAAIETVMNGEVLFTQENLRVLRPFSTLPAKLVNMLKGIPGSGEGKLFFVSHEEYYELRAKAVAATTDKFTVLMQLNNLSRASEAARTSRLDEGMRQVYTLFERITLLDLKTNTIEPLYVGIRENLVSGRENIPSLAEEYANRWIDSKDRGRYLAFMDVRTMGQRFEKSGKTHLVQYFRTWRGHGEYSWKQYILLRFQPDQYVEMIRDAQKEVQEFHESYPGTWGPAADSAYSPELLWDNLVHSGLLRLFWKDRDRRFLGASQGFLDYYGFDSDNVLLGKTDEDMAWHIQPDVYEKTEQSVIQEGLETRNIPGWCLSRGENREILASKFPMRDRDGSIIGLMGYFIDRELLTVNDVRGEETRRRDMLTGLLNSRGVSEETHAFRDVYYLREIDFVRAHISLNNLAAINREFSFDFGDRVLDAVARKLRDLFGLNSALGRYNGSQFVLLHQIQARETASSILGRIRQGITGIREIGGQPVTLFISIGLSLYSETEDIERQAQQAETRMLMDHNENATADERIAKASEIFRLYDDLPIAYAVYRVRRGKRGGGPEITVVYVNRAFEARAGKTARELSGVSTREAFPTLTQEWYDKAYRAAILGETVAQQMDYEGTGKRYFMTASQVIRPGYCCFTYQEIDAAG